MLTLTYGDGPNPIGDTNTPPKHDNDNWGLLGDSWTPAEALHWIRLRKARLRREVLADFRLRSCPEHRLTWDIAHAMERCCLFQYYGVRD